MRVELRQRKGERLRFTGVVDRYGYRTGINGESLRTICIKRIHYRNGAYATDHTWFTVSASIASLDLEAGDRVSFEAEISTYIKGYVNVRLGIDNRCTDYRLSRATDLKRLYKMAALPVAA